jgi:hypothetical protein
VFSVGWQWRRMKRKNLKIRDNLKTNDMKKTILTIAILLITLSGFAQKQTSQDVKEILNNKVGNNVIEITPAIQGLLTQYSSLRAKELRIVPIKNLITQNTPNFAEGFCITCRCRNDGYFDAKTCGMYVGSCGECPACHSSLVAFIQKCADSPCLQYY